MAVTADGWMQWAVGCASCQVVDHTNVHCLRTPSVPVWVIGYLPIPRKEQLHWLQWPTLCSGPMFCSCLLNDCALLISCLYIYCASQLAFCCLCGLQFGWPFWWTLTVSDIEAVHTLLSPTLLTSQCIYTQSPALMVRCMVVYIWEIEYGKEQSGNMR